MRGLCHDIVRQIRILRPEDTEALLDEGLRQMARIYFPMEYRIDRRNAFREEALSATRVKIDREGPVGHLFPIALHSVFR